MMTTPHDPYCTTAFGATLDQEIADALRAGMTLEAVYAELAARTLAVANKIIANQTHHLQREIERETS